MLCQDKKAIAMSFLALIIITLVSFGALIGTGLSFKSMFGKVSEGTNCYASLGLQRAGDNVPLFTYENTCKTIVVDIPKSRRSTRTNEDLSKEIAGKLVRTWDIIHKGNVENMWKSGDSWALFSGGNKGCMMMYQINLEYLPKFRKDGKVTDKEYYYEELKGYMIKNNYKKVRGTSTNYYNYIQDSGAAGSLIFPEMYTKKEDGTKSAKTELVLLKEGGQYAISIISPNNDWFNWLIDGRTPTNILMFSTVSFAESKGCFAR